MDAKSYIAGLRLRGQLQGERIIVDWHRVADAYAACDPAADIDKESYLSAYVFNDLDLWRHVNSHGKTAGYAGPCWSSYLVFDLDRYNLGVALSDCRKLALAIQSRYSLCDNQIAAWFSGGKGFHISVPTSLWAASPSVDYNRASRQMAELLAAEAGVTIDTSVYDKLRLIRAPNSRHPQTELCKRWLSIEELIKLNTDGIRHLARHPVEFEYPTAPICQVAVADWATAQRQVAQAARTLQMRNGRPPTLCRHTRDFIASGAAVGERAKRLFEAAANLAEIGCSDLAISELLREPARNSGLPPAEICRQIECGIHRVRQVHTKEIS